MTIHLLVKDLFANHLLPIDVVRQVFFFREKETESTDKVWEERYLKKVPEIKEIFFRLIEEMVAASTNETTSNIDAETIKALYSKNHHSLALKLYQAVHGMSFLFFAIFANL